MMLGTRTYITRRRKKVTHNRETGLVHCEIQVDIIATDTDRTPILIAEPSLWSASPRVDCSFVQCLHVLNFPQTLNERPRHIDVVQSPTHDSTTCIRACVPGAMRMRVLMARAWETPLRKSCLRPCFCVLVLKKCVKQV